VVRPYPFTEFELQLGVSFEELYIIVWAWLMNILAVSQGIWYNPTDDIRGPYYRTPWCYRPFKIEKGADWWGSWSDYKGNAYDRLPNFMEYLECIRFIRGVSARDNKAFINQWSLKDVGVPLFRQGDFYHYEPGWSPRWMKYSYWKNHYPYEYMPPVWMFPGKHSGRLSHELYNTLG